MAEIKDESGEAILDEAGEPILDEAGPELGYHKIIGASFQQLIGEG